MVRFMVSFFFSTLLLYLVEDVIKAMDCVVLVSLYRTEQDGSEGFLAFSFLFPSTVLAIAGV